MQNAQRTQASPIHRLDMAGSAFAEALPSGASADPGAPAKAATGSFTRLASCHVANFGKLHDQSFDFGPGLNVIEAANGVGKTTLANFVRAMFYGFEDKGEELGTQDLRSRYFPWQGGPYGGEMVFEGQSGAFRVERTFGRAASEDTLTVFDLASGRRVPGLEADLGRQVFGMDADSFERSTYVARLSGPHTRPTQRMLAKLTGADDTRRTPEPAGAQDVDQVAARHARLCQQSRECTEELRRIEGLFGDQAPFPNALAELEGALLELREAREAQGRRHDELAAVRDFVARTERRFPQGLPGGEEVAANQRMLSQIEAARAQGASQGLTAADQAELHELERAFAQGQPSEEEMANCQRAITQLDQLAGAAESLTPDELQVQRMGVLDDYFAQGVPTDEEIRRCRALLASAQTMRTMDTAQLATADAKSSMAAKALAGLGGVLVAAGLVVAVVLYLPAAGCAIAVAGAAALVAALLLALLGKTGSSRRARAAAGQTQQDALALEAQARAFTARYARDAEPDKAIEAIARLKAEHDALGERLAHSRARLEEVQDQQRPLRGRVDSFLGGYLPAQQVEDGPQQALSRLRAMVEARARLEAARQASQQQAQASKRQAEELMGKLVEFLAPYYPDASPGNAGELLANLAGAVGAYGEAERMLAEAQGPGDAGEARLAQAQERLAEVCARHGWNAAQTDEAFLQHLAQAMAAYTTTQAKLEAAHAQLRELVATYGPPPYGPDTPEASDAVERGFASYIDRFSGIAADGVAVDGTSGAVVRQQGRTHQIAELSQGYSDVIAFCMRMALGDALFKGAKPFIILDDPFVNLDDRHLGEALAFVEDLARSRQIVYLTCHSSRAL